MESGTLGYKYVSHHAQVIIGYRHGHLYLTPIFDSTKGHELQRLCHKLTDCLGLPIVLKKFDAERYPHITVSPPVRRDSVMVEDDAEPETVLHLQKLFASDAGALNPVSRKLLRRAKSFEYHAENTEVIEDIRKVPLKKIEAFLARDKEKHANYIEILRYMHGQAHDRFKYKAMIFLIDNEVRGLYMVEVLSVNEVGLYGAITSKDVGGITEWMDIYFFKSLYTEGIRTIYLGGAENSGIAFYISDKLFAHRPGYRVTAMMFNPVLDTEQIEFTIRPIRESDFGALAELYGKAYNSLDELGEKWNKETARKLIVYFYRRQPDLFFLAEHAGVVVGAAVSAVQPWWDGNHLVEGEIFINSTYSDTSVSRKLLKALLSRAKQKYAVVAWDTIMPTLKQHPLGAYRHIGFSKVDHWAPLSGDVDTILNHLD